MSRSTPQLAAREVRATLRWLLATLAETDRIILRHFRRAHIDYKQDGSEVTIADRRAEELLRRRPLARARRSFRASV